ncbi:hypothetical protein XFLM_10875 [Xylella fastidiosa subsp. fastidiosa GB514]|nr:hypothetical protein XFLM_10875 [Xylella fastidiosa subsp. fastidiosa GB514]KAF0570354.1 hypothetical protein P305_10820 [Xylella fastidiosa subsp. fastidiosa Mus-1]SHG93978.1 hypothetical protein SAMN05660380_01776 [Xylella fastidiosa]
MSVLALDVAPISEFDHAKVDERFFVELQQRSIFLIHLGPDVCPRTCRA